MTARRHRRLAALAARARAAEDAPPADWSDVRAVLDEELAALSDEHRAALVLCDVNGRSRSEAARDLGWPEGTVATRLAKARQVVAGRLRRRGVALSAAGLPGLLAADASAAVTPELAGVTVAAALGPPAAVPPAVQTLALGVMSAMSHTTGTMLAVVVALAGLFGVGVLAATGGPPDKPPAEAKKMEPDRTPATPKPEGWKPAKTVELPLWLAGSLAYSPDGRLLVVGGTGGNIHGYDAATFENKWVARTEGNFAAVAFSPDGKTLGATAADGALLMEAAAASPALTAVPVEEKGSNPTALAFFPDVSIDAGGQTLTSRKLIFGNAAGYHVKGWLRWPPQGGIATSTAPPGKEPADRFAVPLAVDPAGRSVVLTGPIHPDTGRNVLWAWAAGDHREGGPGNRVLEGHKATVVSAAWAGNGKIVVTGDADGTVVTWDAATMTERARRTFSGRVVGVAAAADGSRLAAAVARTQEWDGRRAYSYVVWVWRADRPQPAEASFDHDRAVGSFNGVGSVAFAPDGTRLAATFCNFEQLADNKPVGRVRVWARADAK